MWNSILLMISVLIGLSSVAMGAYIDHGLSSVLSAEQMKSMLTALRYHQLYAVVIIMMVLILKFLPLESGRKRLTLSVLLFMTSLFMFVGSIYVINIYELTSIRLMTPFGGFLFMLSWLSLGLLCYIKKKHNSSAIETIIK